MIIFSQGPPELDMSANLTTYKQPMSKYNKKNATDLVEEDDMYYPHIRDMPVDVSNIKPPFN
jgi:hypothetical protein